MKVPTNLPEGYVESHISAIENEFIQIIYAKNSSEICFRKAEGNGDISGDYNDYKDIKVCPIGGKDITIKGQDGAYNVAIWQEGAFSYAIQLNEAMEENELVEIISSIQ